MNHVSASQEEKANTGSFLDDDIHLSGENQKALPS